jgi:hypothetical protein
MESPVLHLKINDLKINLKSISEERAAGAKPVA